MPGRNLKDPREAKAWSQAHLADAAGLNIRTIQRIESGEPCSYETMLSLAAALGIDVSELDTRITAAPVAHGFNLSPLSTAIAAVALLPATLFIVVNLLRSLLGMDAPYLALAGAGSRLMSFATFYMVSPAVFLGGAAIALAIALPALLRLRWSREGHALVLNGVEVRASAAPLALSLVALVGVLTLVGYVVAEQLFTPLS